MSFGDSAGPNYVSVQITTTEDPDYSFAGQIWSASERFLRLLLRAPIQAGELLEMSIEGCSVGGEVTFCQPCPEGFNVGVQLLDRDSIRREPRFPLDLPAVLTVLGSTGPREVEIRLTDVSPSGVGLFSTVPAQVGACVEINLDLGLLFGEVRHCQQGPDGRFRIGVAIYHMMARQQTGKSAVNPAPKFRWFKRKNAAAGK